MDNHSNSTTIKPKPMYILICVRIYEEPSMINFLAKIVTKLVLGYSTIILLMDQPTRTRVKQLCSKGTYEIFNKSQHVEQIDFIVTIGGDGTILYAAKQFEKVTPPLLTFQKGTLGFLCKFKPQEADHVIQAAMQTKKYPKQFSTIQDFPLKACRLMRLHVLVKNYGTSQNVSEQKKVVLNQVAITRKDWTRIALQIFIDGQYITTTTGDGVLVSTPTGSTAYALSSGGPIVLNGVNTIILVPLAPNSLAFRPICLPSTSVINIRLSNTSKSNAIVSFDGQSNIQLTQSDQIQIRYVEGDKNSDLILYEPKLTQNHITAMPTWMQRLKHYLGWNQVFKSPACQVLSKSVSKIQ